jgi:hypothetical protein
MRIGRKPLALAIAVAAVAAPAAQAATDTTSVTVAGANAPTLSAAAFGDFGTVNLDGTRQSANASVSNWSVTDATGTGRGWTVQTSATTPENADASHTLATAVLSVSAPTVAAADAQNGSAAPAVTGGNVIDSGGVTAADAGTGAGMGEWDFTQGSNDLALIVPSDAYADTYTSTITTTISQGL